MFSCMTGVFAVFAVFGSVSGLECGEIYKQELSAAQVSVHSVAVPRKGFLAIWA